MSTTIRDARLAACRKWPLGTSVILSTKPIPTPQMPYPVGIDKFWRLYYNPEILGGLSVEQAGICVLQEIGHILYRHGRRAEWLLGPGASEHHLKLWNQAADIAMNYGLELEGIQLPEGSLTHKKFGYPAGRTAEDYFGFLEQDNPPPKQQPQSGNGKGQGQPGNQKGQGNGKPDPKQGEQPGQQPGKQPGEGQGQGDSQNESQDSSGESHGEQPQPYGTNESQGGSAADGIPRAWELPPDEKHEAEFGKFGRDAVLRECARKIVDKSRGNERSQGGHWVNDLLKPDTDPVVKLRALVSRKVEQITSGQGDYSYRRPSRRSTRTVLLAGNVAPVPRVAILIDTSGSMDQGDIGVSLGAVNRVIQGLGIREGLDYYCGDTAIHSSGTVLSAKDIKLRGGGGTSMNSLIESIANTKDHKRKPDLVICCTDGYTPWPQQKCDVPVLAAITTPGGENSDIVKSIPKHIEHVCLRSVRRD